MRPLRTVGLSRLLTLVLLLSLAAPRSSSAQEFFPQHEPPHSAVVFGCEPGPIEPFHRDNPPLPPAPHPSDEDPVTRVAVAVDGSLTRPPIHGNGFNLEHTLWSCPTFRPSLRRGIVEPFRPAVVRVDTGQLPFAPDGVPAEFLGWTDYQAMMSADRYQPSWEFIRRLNASDVRVILGVWGAPGAFTDDGTRLGRLLPEHYDRYVEYYTAMVDYLVRVEGLNVWAATVMNEPDGGDGTLIDPIEFVEVARRLGPSLAQYGVSLYGPDTASAENGLPYLELLLDAPDVMPYFGAIATHQYYPSHHVDVLVERVLESGYELPVYITEYTSFGFGSLDRGEETHDEVGFMLDIASTAVSLYNSGADAALYWDAVDYYQAGHAAVTRWGLLQGPDEAFFPRKRYFGMLQILPFLQPGSRILDTVVYGNAQLRVLGINTPGGIRDDVAIALVNQGGPLDVHLMLYWMPDLGDLQVYLTDDSHDLHHLGRLEFEYGRAELYVPARSIVTLAPAAAPDEGFSQAAEAAPPE